MLWCRCLYPTLTPSLPSCAKPTILSLSCTHSLSQVPNFPLQAQQAFAYSKALYSQFWGVQCRCVSNGKTVWFTAAFLPVQGHSGLSGQLGKLERRKSFPHHALTWELHSPGIRVLPDGTDGCLTLVSDIKVKPRAIKRTGHVHSLVTGSCGLRHVES